MNISVNVTATPEPDGSVKCGVECNGQEATLWFTGTDVIVGIPELPAVPGQQS